MSPSRLGARKAAARRLVEKGAFPSVEAYLSKMVDGYRWCSDCQEMHMREQLGRDAGRPGGRAGRCRKKGRGPKESNVGVGQTSYEGTLRVGDSERQVTFPVTGMEHEHKDPATVKAAMVAVVEEAKARNPGMDVSLVVETLDGMLTA